MCLSVPRAPGESSSEKRALLCRSGADHAYVDLSVRQRFFLVCALHERARRGYFCSSASCQCAWTCILQDLASFFSARSAFPTVVQPLARSCKLARCLFATVQLPAAPRTCILLHVRYDHSLCFQQIAQTLATFIMQNKRYIYIYI